MEKESFIKELNDKDQFKTIFLSSEKQILKDKNGRSYLSVNLSDKTGTLNARLWEKAEELGQKFSSGDYILVKGHIQTYQGRKQIVVHDLSPVASEGIKLEDFLASSSRPSAEMIKELDAVVASIEDPHIKKLLELTTQDPDLRPLILTTPAAKSIHHAFVGGLLEHILSICGVMEPIAKHYPFLRRDLLLFGAIYHDIGKVKELAVTAGTQYTDEGRLIGHLVIAVEFIERFSKEIPGFPDELKMMCKHIVLSHHGKLEYGSPKRPKFLEALVVSMIDEMDSRIDSIRTFMQQENESGEETWTRYNSQYDRYLYLK